MIFSDALLLSIHLGDRSTTGGVFGFLIMSLFDETWETKTDTPTAITTAGALRIDAEFSSRFIAGAESEIGTFDFPDESRFEPDIGLILWDSRMGIEGLAFIDDMFG